MPDRDSTDNGINPIEQRIILMARHQRDLQVDRPLTRRTSHKRRRHALQIMQSCRIHITTAEEIWSAPQFGNTTLARQALRLFLAADRSPQWRRDALSLLTQLRHRGMPATALELFQWVALSDAAAVPEGGTECPLCIDGQDRRHAPSLTPFCRSQLVVVLAASWRLQYPHTEAATHLAERSLDEFEMLADCEAAYPQIFGLVLTAAAAYLDALRLEDSRQPYSIAACELLLTAAYQVRSAARTAGDIKSYPNLPLSELLMHWSVQLLFNLDIPDAEALLEFWSTLTRKTPGAPRFVRNRRAERDRTVNLRRDRQAVRHSKGYDR
ncbi:MAG: hypothetical protein U0105_22480 [Candidatus Obscuribacterales bacterium]